MPGGVMLALFAASANLNAQSLVFPNFSSTSGLTLNSSATAATGDGTVLRLVTATSSDTGSAFSTSLRTVTGGFSTAFDFRLSNRGGSSNDGTSTGADGFVFVLQRAGNSSLGGSGEYLGFGGGSAIGTSLGIEFDTYKNTSQSDPSSNHIGVDLNGSVISVATANVTPDFDSVGSGTRWTAWIDYNGTTIEVRVSNTGARPATADLSYAISSATFQSTLGSNTTAFVGFTAATGGSWANHDIIDWTFSETYVPGGVTAGSAIPEPSMYTAFAGMAVLVAARLMRRCRHQTG